MSRFKREPSDKYLAAVNAIRELLNDGDDASRAFAEATSEHYKEQFAKDNDVKLSHGGNNLDAKRISKNSSVSRLPGSDHDTYWRKGRMNVCVAICQPYHLGLETLREIVEFCDNNGLDVVVQSHPSFHFPSRTLSVIYSRKKQPE